MDQCFCDNQIYNSAAMSVDLKYCNAPCYGDATEMCGGTSGYMSLYEIGGVYSPVYVTTTTTTAVPTYTGVARNLNYAFPGGYRFLGCFTDYFSVGGAKTLQYPYKADSMYVEECAYLCSTYYPQGSYMGLEAGTLCYCGQQINPENVLVTSTSGYACSSQCAQNSTEICGGPYAMSVYSTNNTQTYPADANAVGINGVLPITTTTTT